MRAREFIREDANETLTPDERTAIPNMEKFNDLDRISILVNKTREEIARDYITKVEVRSDMDQIINRFDRIEAKLDRFIEGHK